jgi:hypothetical protein
MARHLVPSLMRSQQLFGSLLRRQKCFLDTPEWRELALNAPGRDSFSELQDIVACLPGLSEAADRCHRRNDGPRKQEMVMAFSSVLHQLATFGEREWPPGALTTLTNLPRENIPAWLTDIPNLGKAHTFCTWRSANMYCTWTMVRLMVQLEIQKLLHNSVDEKTSPTMDGLDQDILDSIKDCLLGIPYQIGLKACSIGVMCSMRPLKTTMILLNEYGKHEEAQWCQNVVDALHDLGFK